MGEVGGQVLQFCLLLRVAGRRLQEQCCVADGLLLQGSALTALCLALKCASGSLSVIIAPKSLPWGHRGW